jgi:hypothetical protein
MSTDGYIDPLPQAENNLAITIGIAKGIVVKLVEQHV